MKLLVSSVFLFFLLSCGVEEQQEMLSQQEEEDVSSSSTLYDYEYDYEYLTVEGYISPINITVNNESYSDSEDFYTQELLKLQEEVKKDYPDYELSFDAAVGLRHFKSGMYVFLVASSETGVASETYVDSSGKFSFLFESEDVDTKDMYTLRTSKRIGLRLIKGDDVITWCYNMYAEKEMALEVSPIILRHFHTKITKYRCSGQSSGISLPEREDPYYEEPESTWEWEYVETEEERELSIDTTIEDDNAMSKDID